MKTHQIVKFSNIVCLVLLAVILVLQFTPFWSVDGQGISIGTYIWFPTEHTEVTTYMQSNVSESFNVLSLVGSHCLILVGAVFAAFFFLKNTESINCTIFSVIAGIGGLWGYGTKAAYQLGNNWTLHLLICILLTVAAAVGLVVHIRKVTQDKKK